MTCLFFLSKKQDYRITENYWRHTFLLGCIYLLFHLATLWPIIYGSLLLFLL